MIFKVVAEGYDDVPEECLAMVQAVNEHEAMEKFSIKERNLKYSSDWNCYMLGWRKIFPVKRRNDENATV